MFKKKSIQETNNIHLRSNLSSIKEFILDLKNYSPVGLVGIIFFINIMVFIEILEAEYLKSFLIMTIIVGCICFIVLKWALDFRILVKFDTQSIPIELAAYEVSYKVSKRYAVIDSEGKPSIFKNYIKCKKGEGFIVNNIDDVLKISYTNMIHNNIDIVPDFIEAFNLASKSTVSLTHEVNRLKAVGRQEALIETVDIMNSLELTEQLTRKIKQDELLEIQTADEKFMEKYMDDYKAKHKEENKNDE